MLIALVRAARNNNRKNAKPNNTPPGIIAKTSGSAMKAKPPPIPRPSAPIVAKTTGTIAKPAKIATSVSKKQIITALRKRFSFLGTYEP